MKTLLTILILTISTVCFAQFHIRVQCYAPNISSDYYEISFTNDNWETSNTIKEVNDNISYDDYDTEYVSGYSYGTRIFMNKDEAIEVAKRYKTFQMCMHNVTYQYKIWMDKRQWLHNHPPHPKRKSKELELLKRKKCCTVTQIY